LGRVTVDNTWKKKARSADDPRVHLERLSVPAPFGFVPRRHIPAGVKIFDTMNARSESVEQKRSFSRAWKNLQLALIPCISFFEPDYETETGNAVRWKIGTASGNPARDRRGCGVSGRKPTAPCRSRSRCSQSIRTCIR